MIRSSQLDISIKSIEFNRFLAKSLPKMASGIKLSAKGVEAYMTRPSHTGLDRYFELCDRPVHRLNNSTISLSNSRLVHCVLRPKCQTIPSSDRRSDSVLVRFFNISKLLRNLKCKN